jgi:hypothetical protein
MLVEREESDEGLREKLDREAEGIEDPELKELLEHLDKLIAQREALTKQFDPVSAGIDVRSEATSDPPKAATATADPAESKDLSAKLEQLKETLEKLGDTKNESVKWSASNYAFAFGSVVGIGARVMTLIAHLARKAHSRPTDDLPPLGLKRPRGAIELRRVVAVGASFLALAAASAAAAPTVALGGPTATSPKTISVPTQCDGQASNSDQAKGCLDSNPLLGPKELPTTGRVRSVDGDIAKLTRGYKPSGSTTEAAFLDLYYNNDSWKYPPDGGFAIDPDTMRPIHHVITLEPLKDGKRVFVDRFGAETGSYLAPAGTSYAKRALPPQSLDTFPDGPPYNYHVYVVIRPFRVDAGPIAPWFGQKGGGVQFVTCVTAMFHCPKALDPSLPNVAELVKEGDLRPQVLPLR